MLRTYKKSINNKINSSKGFTLTELIVVLAVLGILAALTVPAFSGYINKAKDRQIQDEARKCVMAAQTLLDEKIATSPTVATTDITSANVLQLAGLTGKGAVSDIAFTTDNTQIKTLTYTHNATNGTPAGDGKKCKYTDAGTYTSNYYNTTACD